MEANQNTSTPQPMRFHGPGWELTTPAGTSYWLWAPQDEAPEGSPNPPRDHWAACWQSEDGEDGDFRKGETLEAVLRGFFPGLIAKVFREVAKS